MKKVIQHVFEQRRLVLSSLLAVNLCGVPLTFAQEPVPVDQFVNYESGHVHPLDMTPDGTKLLAVNTANNSLEVFTIEGDELIHAASIPVGHDPISVRVRNNAEAWVANVISDTVSIVDLNLNVVVNTLQTENEPSDIVFAGTPEKAFVSCAERESIQVFNLDNLQAQPQEILLIGEQPKAMAVSPDGQTVYTAFFESGNQTTVISGNQTAAGQGFFPLDQFKNIGNTKVRNDVRNPRGPYGGRVPVPNDGDSFKPALNPDLPAKTDTQSLVVKKQKDGRWLDDNDGDWTNIVTGGQGQRTRGWDLKDRDVAKVNANSLDVTYQHHQGNILMAMGVNPSSGEVSIVGTDATNHIRFEPNLNGSFLRVNISQFSPGDDSDFAAITDLNPHLDYSTPSIPENERFQSVGDPRGIAWKANGEQAYVSGMGSNNLILINRNGQRIEQQPIDVGEGPTGLVVDDARNQVYVLNKFDGSISIVDTQNNAETGQFTFFDPTPEDIKQGRRHLYNTHEGSGNGTIACGSCHVDGKWDRLAWDLGNPAGQMERVRGKNFSPLKGLKVTQSLIDIIGKGPLHWRGDKAEFGDFHNAFNELQGRDEEVDQAKMESFSNLLKTTYHPPNPYRSKDARSDRNTNRHPGFGGSVDSFNPNFGDLDRTIRGPGTSFQQRPRLLGSRFVEFCFSCHTNATGRGAQDYFGNENIPADLRTTYRKLGFYYNSPDSTVGFGMMSDGIMATRFDGNSNGGSYFFDYGGFPLIFSGGAFGADNSQDSHPALGMQVTISDIVDNSRDLQTLLSRANTHRRQLSIVVKGLLDGEERGFVYQGGNRYASDREGEVITHNQLLALARASGPLTWTLVQPQTANRLGIDRNADGLLNSEDRDNDGDGLNDRIDSDDDNDGIPDEDDFFPFIRDEIPEVEEEPEDEDENNDNNDNNPPNNEDDQARWIPAQGLSWQYQLDGVINTQVDADVYTIDLSYARSDVEEIKALNKFAVCSFSAGTNEDFRFDSADIPDAIQGEFYDEFGSERVLNIRALESLKPIMEARLDDCVDKGFDGVLLEKVSLFDHTSIAERGTSFNIEQAENVRYIQWFAAEAHKRGLALGLKDGVGLVNRVLDDIDFMVADSCFASDWCADAAVVTDANKPVFMVEFAENQVELEAMCQTANTYQFSGILRDYQVDGNGDAYQACDIEQGEWWKPAVGTTWQYQLDGEINTNYDVDAFDIDLSYGADVVAQIKAQDKKAVCYFSVSTAETFRADSGDFPSEVLGERYDEFSDERVLDIRNIDALAPVMRARLDECVAKGFDGVDLDKIDIFAHETQVDGQQVLGTSFQFTPQDSVRYLQWFANEAHQRGLAVGLKNGLDIIPNVVNDIDFMIADSCFTYSWCDVASPVVAANKPVFMVEYTENAVDFNAMCARAKDLGFSAILRNSNLQDETFNACQ